MFEVPKLILLHTAASWSALFYELRSGSPLNLSPLPLFGRHVDALEADCCQAAQEIREVELNVFNPLWHFTQYSYVCSNKPGTVAGACKPSRWADTLMDVLTLGKGV